MILKEYLLRGLVRSALILTPASLVSQWQEELATKFGLTQFRTTSDSLAQRDPDAFWQEPYLIASLATAKRSPHAERVCLRPFGLVIVDEAHLFLASTAA